MKQPRRPTRQLDTEIEFSTNLRQLTPAQRLALFVRLQQYRRQLPPERIWWIVFSNGEKRRL